MITRSCVANPRAAWAAVGLLCLLAAALCKGAEARAQESAIPATVVTADDVDAANSGLYRQAEREAVDPQTLLAMLGVTGNPRDWSAGRVEHGNEGQPVHFLVAFRKPITIGTVQFTGSARSLKVHKVDSPYPPDPADAKQWATIDVPAGQSGGHLATLPPGTRTRALLLTDPKPSWSSELRSLRLYAPRLFNLTPLARAYAESEYTEYSAGTSAPVTYAASTVTTGGWPHWQNTGKDPRGRIPRAPVSELEPTWFMLTWREPQTVNGLWLNDNFEKIQLEYYTGPDDLNPRAGTDREWKSIRETKEKLGAGRLVTFDPITTRGLRVVILKTSANQIARIHGLHALADLKDRPKPPAHPPAIADAQAPPLTIPYRADFDGYVTMVINTPHGRRVRNLFARRTHEKGDHAAGWDLKDEMGRTVPAGEYEWKAIGHPPLRLKYEMTAYPNVTHHSPGSTPWITSAAGPGGWLADHSASRAGAASGDHVFFGAPVAESGVSMICCDLTGRKLWAVPGFAGFTGSYWLAADGETVYSMATAATVASAWQVDPSTEAVWAVDVKTQHVRELARLEPTSARRRGIKGAAARDGKLYLSIGAQEDWLATAAGASDVDVENCFPKYPPRRKEKYAMELVPDPRNDFLRLFRLVATPPGGNGLVFLETTRGKAARRHVVLAFKKPVPIGSAVLPRAEGDDVRVKLSVLKPDAPYPPNPGDPSQWQSFEKHAELPWDVAVAPKNVATRAVRVTFVRGDVGDDDLLTAGEAEEYSAELTGEGIDLSDTKTDRGGDDLGLDGAGGGSEWMAKLEGIKLLPRRFENVAGAAEVHVNSGTVGKDGSWDARRDRPVSESDPGVYVMEWKTPQPLRGLAIKEVDGRRTEIDVYTGPADSPIDIAAPGGWEKVASYLQPRRSTAGYSPATNPAARYLDGYVDFGREIKTRAVRLRVVEQWAEVGMEGPRWDVPADRALDATRCRVLGVAAMKYVGGEPKGSVDPKTFSRVEVIDGATGKVSGEVALAAAGPIAFSPGGALLAVAGRGVVEVDLAGGTHKPIVPGDLVRPAAMAIDKAGNVYVYDNAPERRNIRVYSSAGKLLRTIGTPGGYNAGPWDPTRLQDVTSLAIDSRDQLWAVGETYFPKRISRWTLDGKFQRDYLGNTGYGGGGVLDAGDKSRLFYGPLEFALDWKTGKASLKNLTWTGDTPAGEVPVRIAKHTYVVTRGEGHNPPQRVGIVYLYEKDHLRRVAAVGEAAAFAPLARVDLQSALAGKSSADYDFAWSDRNGDGEVQAAEVALSPRRAVPHRLTGFGRDLSIHSGALRYQVKEFLPDGVPVFEQKVLPLPLSGREGDGVVCPLDNGHFFRFSAGADTPSAGFAPDGKLTWEYPTEGPGTHALVNASPFTPEQVVCEFSIIGQARSSAGDLGDFFVVHTNLGGWNLWTADGMLAGWIFNDQRVPGVRAWNMPGHKRGMAMDDVTVGQEHFQGHFCKTADGKYYAVAGHNHASIVEVIGMDAFKRSGGKIAVLPEQIVATQEWERGRQKVEVYDRAPVLDVFRTPSPPKIDGDAKDWGEYTVGARLGDVQGGRIRRGASFRAAWDERNLYLCYEVRDLGPMKNTGREWDRLFKTGAAVDLQIGTDPATPRDRKAPVAGDKRLLMTFTEKAGAPRGRAVLYDAVVPGTPAEKAWKAVSPVGSASFDRVVELENVSLAYTEWGGGYVIEAAVPLSALGLAPKDDTRLKLDWGVLAADPAGNSVMRRLYWANGATGIVADVPSEARLHPDLWGYALLHDRGRTVLDAPTELIGGKEGSEGIRDVGGDEEDPSNKIIEDFESELEEDSQRR